MGRPSNRACLLLLTSASLVAVLVACAICGAVVLFTQISPEPDVTAPTSSSISSTPIAGPENSDWLRTHALPLETVEPYDGDDFGDLMPLKDLIGDARIVALGEATHGTHEFFTMKHRMVRFLVQEMGFNVFAIEDNWTEATFVNDYVLYGEGDATTAVLKGINYWTWRTEEVRDMVAWMRRHNESPGASPLVSFHGFDVNKEQTLAIDNVVRFLEDVDPPSAAEAGANYECFYAEDVDSWYPEVSRSAQDECRAGLQAVMDVLLANQERYIALSSPEAYEVAVQSARVVLQAEDVFGQDDPQARDRHMAENARWLLDQAGSEAKIILWAHNAHVSGADPEECEDCLGMGHHLRQVYGDNLVIFGFAFNEGQVTAIGPDWELTAHPVSPAPPETFEWYAHNTGLPAFILNLRGLGADEPGAAWLTQPLLFRSVGSMYDPTVPEEWFCEYNLPRAFDAIIYVDQTTATWLLP